MLQLNKLSEQLPALKFISIAALFSMLMLSVGHLQAQYGTGLVFDDEAYEEVQMKAPLTRGLYGDRLPSVSSLKAYCPTPQSQGDLGTCVGWATNWAARTIIESMHNGYTTTQEIEAHAFSPGFIYHMIKEKKDKDCTYGTSIHDALNFMKYNGSVRFADFSMQCSNEVDPYLVESAEQYQLKDFARLFGKEKSNEFKISSIKKSLSEYNPVVIGIKCPISFYDAKDVWEPYENPETVPNGHAVCVVGYDDNKYGGAFEVMNSWGTVWGNGGFTWIPYADFARFTKYAYELIHEPLPMPSGPQVAISTPVPNPTPLPIPASSPSQSTKPTPVPPVPIPTPQVATADLGGALALVNDRGQRLQAEEIDTGHYRLKKPMRSGSSFRVYLSNNEPAYVYLIGSDATGALFQLFPYSPEISAMLNYRQNEVALPSEEHFITLDATVGTDYLCVLYSKQPLKIEEVKRIISETEGSFPEKVERTLGGFAVDYSNINFEKDAMGFKAISKEKTIVPLILAIQHID